MSEQVKTCSKCKQLLPFGCFGKSKETVKGLYSRCKVCRNEDRECWRERNRDLYLSKRRENYRKDPTKNIASSRKWQRGHPDKVRAAQQNRISRNPLFYVQQYARLPRQREQKKARSRAGVQALSDLYIRHLIRRHALIKYWFISQELIEAKRLELKINRLITEKRK